MITAVAVAVAALAAPGRAGAGDPYADGPYAVTTVEYDAGLVIVPPITTVAGSPVGGYPARLRGTLYIPSAPGPRPVVVFAHGRHATCRAAGGVEQSAWPCPQAPPAVDDLPSWRGFGYVARHLASRGYLVASASTTSFVDPLPLTDDGYQREQLVMRTLDLLAEWVRGPRASADGVGAMLAGRVDLSRIALVGHSRGADAVTQLVVDDWRRPAGRRYPGIRAVLSIAPPVLDPDVAAGPPGVHFGMLLGTCDSDTSVVGAGVWDAGRYVPENAAFGRTQFLVTGANHNFFNSEWNDEVTEEPVDVPFILDYSTCEMSKPDNVRLTPADQQLAGRVLIGSFVRYYLGHEASVRRIVTGAESLPAAACPTERYGAGAPLACAQILQTTYHGPQPTRRTLLLPAADGSTGASGTAITATGFREVVACTPYTAPSPCPERTNDSIARQLRLVWDAPSTLSVRLAPEASDVRAFETLTLRTAMNPSDDANDGLRDQELTVTLVDAAGGSATVAVSAYGTALRRPPAPGPQDGSVEPEIGYYNDLLGGVRIPLDDFAAVDLGSVAEVRLATVTARGSVQLADVLLQEA